MIAENTYCARILQVYDRALSGTEVSALKTAQADTVAIKTMTYDTLNRQTGWTDGTNSETNAYRGAEWHRKSTTTAAGTTTYLYDGDNVVADLTGGGYQKLYVTPGLDQNLSMTDVSDPQNPATYYYTQDGLGSVRHLTSTAGAVVNQYDYTAFGETYAPNTTTTVEQRYTYTGRESSATSGLNYHRYRWADPALGRWTARDPAGYPNTAQANLYLYVENVPHTYTDPDGLMRVLDIDWDSGRRSFLLFWARLKLKAYLDIQVKTNVPPSSCPTIWPNTIKPTYDLWFGNASYLKKDRRMYVKGTVHEDFLRH